MKKLTIPERDKTTTTPPCPNWSVPREEVLRAAKKSSMQRYKVAYTELAKV